MKRRRLMLLLLVAAAPAAVLACGVAGCDDGTDPEPSPSSDSVVATVNGRPVFAGSLEVVCAEQRLLNQSDARAGCLREAIDRELVRQEAERLDVAADSSEVGTRVSDLTDEMGGAEALASALEKARMTEVQLRQVVEDGVLRESLRDAKYGQLKAGETAVRAYYDRHVRDQFTQVASVHLAVINVAAERIAENAIARLRSGHSFAEVARQFSGDSESKENGGDMGWVLESSLPGPLRKAVAALAEGETSKPVATFGRWYVIRLEDRRERRVVPYAEVRVRLRNELSREKRSRALEAWLKQARQNATVTRS